MRILLMLLVSLLLFSSCEEDESVFIRLANGSDVVFDRISFYGVADNSSFGTLAPGDTSVYRRSPIEEGVGSLILRVGSDTIPSICVIIDKAPPPPLTPGHYTYEVGLTRGDTTGLYTLRQLP